MYQKFAQPAPIIFGCGSLSVLGEEVKALGCKKILLISEKGIEEAGIVAKATKVLESAGVGFAVFAGVTADPPDSVVDQAGKVALQEGADCLVGLGGGSSLDTAKAASVLMSYPGPIRNHIFPIPNFVDTKVPVILIPTTAGTGSECTTVAILSIQDLNAKLPIYVKTSLAIVDPELMVSLPRSITASTGMDAFSHAVEAMTSVNWNRHSDLFAEAAIKKISQNLLTCCDEPGNIEARTELALASNWAGLAFNNPITHVGHAAADAISCHYHTPHGLNCALALPAMVELIAPAVPERIRVIANAMSLPLAGNETAEQLGTLVADGIRDLMRKTGIPSLKEMGYAREEVLSFVPEIVASHLSSFCPVKMDEVTTAKLLAGIYDAY